MDQHNTESPEVECKNCGQKFQHTYTYCPYCGQKHIPKLTIYDLFSNFIGNYLSVDGRFFTSIGPLLLKPGYIALNYVNGKRESYLHPAKMYLFISLIFFFIFSFFIQDTEESIRITKLDPEMGQAIDSVLTDGDLNDISIQEFDFLSITSNIDSLIHSGAADEEIYRAMGMKENAGFFSRKFYKQMLKLFREGGAQEVYNTFFDTIPVAMFFLLPVFALILYLFYHRRGNYASHLVFSLYYFSVFFIILGILYASNRWLGGLPWFLDWILALSPMVYLGLGLKKFYNQTWKKTVFKEMGILSLFLLVFVPITFVFVVLYTILFF